MPLCLREEENTLGEASKIVNRLELLGKAKQVNVPLSTFKGKELYYLENIRKIEKPLDNYSYRHLSDNFFLGGERLISVLNSDNESLKQAWHALYSKYPQKLNERLSQIEDSLILSLHKIHAEIGQMVDSNIGQTRLKEMMGLIAIYAVDTKLDTEQATALYRKMIYAATNYHIKRTEEFEDFLFFNFLLPLEKSFVRAYQGALPELFEASVKNSDLMPLLSYLFTFDVKLRQIRIDNPKVILSLLQDIEKNTGATEGFAKLLSIIMLYGVYEKDLRILKHKVTAENISSITDYASLFLFVYGENYKLFFEAYGPQLHNTEHGLYNEKKTKLLEFAIRNKKNAFIQLILEHKELFDNISIESVLFSQKFRNIVNLNTLNGKDLEKIVSICSKEQGDFPEVSLTFNEYLLLYHASPFMRKIYIYLEIPRIDDKIRCFSELPELKLQDIKDSDFDTLMKELNRVLAIKPLSRWRQEEGRNIKKCDKRIFLHFLLSPVLYPYFSQIESEQDILFLLQIKDAPIIKVYDIMEVKRLHYYKSGELNRFINSLRLSPEFQGKYEKEILFFAQRGLVSVVNSYARVYSREQKENLYKLTKAELAGQFHKIKYFGNDLDLEIGMQTPGKVKREWEKDTTYEKGNIFCIDTGDFETTINVGLVPEHTCMAHDRSHNKCMLATFDTNKKILIAKKDGEVVARAILRLTKGMKEKTLPRNKQLGFRDIEDLTDDALTIENPTVKTAAATEDLVLFVERLYIRNCAPEEREIIQKGFVKIAIKKARAMEAKVVVANGYRYITPQDASFLKATSIEKQSYNIFISYSKNGVQYLDSFSGQNTAENEGKYKEDDLIVITP